MTAKLFAITDQVIVSWEWGGEGGGMDMQRAMNRLKVRWSKRKIRPDGRQAILENGVHLFPEVEAISRNFTISVAESCKTAQDFMKEYGVRV